MESQWEFGEFVVTTASAGLDEHLIHKVLSESYWAKGIPREIVARSIRNSLCFGVLRGGKQVGFARVVSDYATFAYLADVFIIEDFRGRGLAKFLMQCIVQHPELQGCAVGLWRLATRTGCTRSSDSSRWPIQIASWSCTIQMSTTDLSVAEC